MPVDSFLFEPPGKPKNIPSPAYLPYLGIELGSLALQADSLPAELPGKLITSWHKDGETMETVTDSGFFGAP